MERAAPLRRLHGLFYFNAATILKTSPLMPKPAKARPSIPPDNIRPGDILYSVTQEDGSVQYTNAIALPLVINITLKKTYNSKYRLDDLNKILSMLTPTNRIARQYGIKSISKMHDLFKSNQEDEDTSIIIGY
ncbi:hypothetical protein PND17_09315 [Streptococcus thermophilus]|uniref:hypothetical protein n=1 Tax=Streptococcus thermophilus TaxID=1308 RepID=UPI002349D257|nr:hypothetical protein [Streptococcus thermophilus]WCL60241.1 hypothetical protein PND17_09315 [Streptococcus thermophilus]